VSSNTFRKQNRQNLVNTEMTEVIVFSKDGNDIDFSSVNDQQSSLGTSFNLQTTEK